MWQFCELELVQTARDMARLKRNGKHNSWDGITLATGAAGDAGPVTWTGIVAP